MSGSKGARASPDLIAACHVFHRLSTPRHPSEALMRLIVLSKTHAWGRFALPAVRKAESCAHTCALCFDVFSSLPSKLQGKPGEPFNSQCHCPARSRTWPENLFHDRLPLLQRACRAEAPLGAKAGGARRDRTDDLMLAKHALYQLSYGPFQEAAPDWEPVRPVRPREVWWAQADSNCRPHAYQACALTT